MCVPSPLVPSHPVGRRITLKDIASKCGVSVATVSYALRGDPRISKQTALTVRAAAEELGYRPDPLLSALISYRSDVKAERLKGEVAMLYPCEKTSPRTRLFQVHRECFGRRMVEHGYTVSDFYLDTLGYSVRRLRQILLARNIRGVVLAWGFEVTTLPDFPWQEFVVVSTERVRVHPYLDRISMNHFRAIRGVMDKIRAKGHSRVGLIFHDDTPPVVKKNILGSYLVEMGAGEAREVPVPFEYSRGENPERFLRWFGATKPTALLSSGHVDHAFLEKSGLSFPGDCALAVAEIDEVGPGRVSGIYVGSVMGQTLADLLVRKIVTYDNVTLDAEGQLLLVNGVWHDGETL